jgi:hypothetical protein
LIKFPGWARVESKLLFYYFDFSRSQQWCTTTTHRWALKL